MKIIQTRICIDCEEVFEKGARTCPACASRMTILLSKWVPPISSLTRDLEMMKNLMAKVDLSYRERAGKRA